MKRLKLTDFEFFSNGKRFAGNGCDSRFFVLLGTVCLSLLLCPLNRLQAGVFDGVPKAVALPDSTSGDEVPFLTLDAGGKPVTMELLGGVTAIPLKGAAARKKAEAGATGEGGAPSEVIGYTLEEAKAQKDGATSWKIKYNLKGKEATCVTLNYDGKAMTFKWRTKVPESLRLPIANCVLKISSGTDVHYLALRKPVSVENIALNMKTGTGSIKSERLDYPLPDPQTVIFEIQSLGSHKQGDSNVILPPPTPISAISAKEPMKILFNFKDSNGNMQTAFSFEVVPAFASSITVALAPPKESAKIFLSFLQMAQDPQIEIPLNKMRTEISQINQKLQKQEGWKRDAKDTNRITELQTKIWGIEQLRQLGKAEAMLRVYIDLGETQVNIMETQPLTEEQKAAKKAKKKSQKATK